MQNLDINSEQFNNLSKTEKQAVLEILNEYNKDGTSQLYNDLLYYDYEEIPVTINEFLHNDLYLGKALIDDEGKYSIFPYWEKILNQIFPTNLDTNYNTTVFTGAIGLGKSTIAVIGVLYELYRMMCLKNPYKHYGLQEIDLITFAFINITLDAARGVAWDKCQQMIQKSKWFLDRGSLTKSSNPTWKPPKGIELITGSNPGHILGRALFACFVDEISFIQNKSVAEQIIKAKKIVNAASTRMQSRFMKGEKNPTILFLASSKRTEQSYLETFISDKKKNNSSTTLIVDEPQWVIRTDKDSPRKFKVAVGNKYLQSELLPLNSTDKQIETYKGKGYTIIDVPYGYYESFVDDLEQSLMDIAGISVSSISRYISGQRITEVIDTTIQNPFIHEVLEIGNGPNDIEQYYNYFDISKIDPELKNKPLYVHLDMSVSGDKTGIGGVFIEGKRHNADNNKVENELYYQIAFLVSIKAPRGYQISFEKNRQFIYWLKEQGFNIKGVSSDTYQSYDTGQALKDKGFNYDIISVDRCTDKICIPYQYLKSTIYEKRIKLFKNQLLIDELIGLERDNNSGVIDHSSAGINSKDSSDALCGSLYNASKHAEEFEYDFGETLDTFIETNNTQDDLKTQIVVNFEEELKRINDPMQQHINNKKDSIYMDFGFGAAQDLAESSLYDGIIL